MLEVGKKAPTFKLKNQDGKVISLEDLKGKKVILYFYPKDDTPGCTREACNFRDDLPEFKGLNAAILGVSPDTVESHKKFKIKYSIPFDLLSDVDREVCEKYEVWKEKNNYGKKLMGVERTTYIIDEKGVISNIFNKVKVDGHNEELIKALEN
jgi:peroxiredoxin Q/BCP